MPRNKAQAESTENAESVEVNEATEATEATATPSDEAATPEATEASAPEASAQPEFTQEQLDLMFNQFTTLADEVSEARDERGEVSEADTVRVRDLYAKLPTTQLKTKARNWLEAQMKFQLSEKLDVYRARAYMVLGTAVKAAPARAAVARPTLDPTEEHIAKVAAFMLAPYLMDVAEGVADDWGNQATAKAQSLQGEIGTWNQYRSELKAWEASTDENKGDAPTQPQVSEIIVSAARLASGRVASRRASGTPRATSAGTPSAPYQGPRRDVKKHIAEAFASQPVGTFLKVAEIAKFKSSEYGDTSPSGGAISAALAGDKFRTAVPHIQPDTQDNRQGARKIADA